MQSQITPEAIHEVPFRYVLAHSIALTPVLGGIRWTSQTTFEPEIPDVEFKASAMVRTERSDKWEEHSRIISLAEARSIVKAESRLRVVCAALGVSELCILPDYS